jgi:adenosine kinase
MCKSLPARVDSKIPISTVKGNSSTVVVSGAMILDLLGQYPHDFATYDWQCPPQCLAFDATQSLTHLVESSGGCASNIAYNLALLGVHALLVSAVGGDFPETHYANLKRVGVDLSGIQRHGPESITSRSVTLTDRAGRQFTFWASNDIGPEKSPALDSYCRRHSPELVIVASNLPAIMLSHLRGACSSPTKLLWAPGCDITSLTREELQAAWTMSNYIVMNEVEWQCALTALGVEEPVWPEGLQAVVVTRGERGCSIYQNGLEPITVPAVAADKIVDPTGCGDSFLAGFAYGLTQKLDLRTSARIGSSVAAFNLESRGTQHHEFTLAQVKARLRKAYGETALP